MKTRFNSNNILIEPIKLTSKELINETNFDDWVSLPDYLCDGLTCKRIKTPKTYDGFLLRYSAGSRTVPHINTEEYEILNVRSGSITNLITDETYEEGDTMVINKNEVHEIYCESEAYIYFVTTKKQSELTLLT